MENIEAWKKFCLSGKIADYLAYKNIKFGENKDEDNGRGISDKGERYQRK